LHTHALSKKTTTLATSKNVELKKPKLKKRLKNKINIYERQI